MGKNAPLIRKLLKIAAKTVDFEVFEAGLVFARRPPPTASGARG
jgi:hypothetical protein